VENTSLAGGEGARLRYVRDGRDWRGSITQEAKPGQARGLQIDWARFADRWRAGYAPSMDKVRKVSFRGPNSMICTVLCSRICSRNSISKA